MALRPRAAFPPARVAVAARAGAEGVVGASVAFAPGVDTEVATAEAILALGVPALPRTGPPRDAPVGGLPPMAAKADLPEFQAGQIAATDPIDDAGRPPAAPSTEHPARHPATTGVPARAAAPPVGVGAAKGAATPTGVKRRRGARAPPRVATAAVATTRAGQRTAAVDVPTVRAAPKVPQGARAVHALVAGVRAAPGAAPGARGVRPGVARKATGREVAPRTAAAHSQGVGKAACKARGGPGGGGGATAANREVERGPAPIAVGAAPQDRGLPQT